MHSDKERADGTPSSSRGAGSQPRGEVRAGSASEGAGRRVEEERLFQLGQRHAAVLAAFSDEMMVLDPGLTIAWANDVVQARFGPLGQIQGRPCHQVRWGRAERCEDCAVTRCFTSGRVEVTLREEPDPAGRPQWLEIQAAPIRDRSDRVVQVVELVRDVSERELALRGLAESERRLHSIVETAGALVIGLDPDGRIAIFNQTCEQVSGYRREDVIGRTMWDLLLPERSFNIGQQVFRHTSRAVPPGRVEIPWRTKDGEERLIAWRITRMSNPEGGATATVGIGIDITDQRRAEEALRASEQRYRSLVQNISQVVFAFRPVPPYAPIYISPDVLDVTGRSAEELIEHPASWQGLLHPEDRARFLRRLGEAIEAKERFELEARYVTRSDAVRDVLVQGSPVFDQAGEVVQYDGTLTDLTAHKRTEALLRQEREWSERVLTDVREMVLAVNWDYEVEYLNPAAEARWGQVEGKSKCFKIVAGRSTPCPDCPVGHFARHRQVDTVHHTDLHLPDGTILDGHSSLMTRPDGGQVVLIVMRDVTEGRKLELRLQHSQRLESIGRLAGGIAHDFNNLIGSITGFAELLKIRLAAGCEEYECAAMIEEASRRAAELTSQLLTFSRRKELEIRAFDLNETVDGALKLLSRTLEKNIQVMTDLAPGPAVIRGDAGQIQQVVINLGLNAAEAMPEGGLIRISSRRRTLREAEVTGRPGVHPGEFIGLSITDTGAGMDGATVSRIFEPFFTTKEMGRGTGLGLSTSYAIVQEHGGCIFVRSEPDAGSTFEVCLPLSLEPVAASPEEVSPGGGPESDLQEANIVTGSETVLVVDDEGVVRDMLRRQLEEMGYRVLTVEGGLEAVDVYGQDPDGIDLVIVDLMMPKVDGVETIQRLRELKSGVRTLVVTGYVHKKDLPERLAGEPCPVLQKPFSRVELSRRVRQVLESS